MIAVIFEVWPKDGRREDYLAIAAQLRAELEKAEGFISIERFQSLNDEGKILSLSYWEDEEAVQRWRRNAHHRKAQTQGRLHLFAEYRLRVAQVARDYGLNDRAQAPDDALALP